MANNRLWAVCKDDNEADCLTKYYPCEAGGWSGPFSNKDEFFKKHENCPSNHGCGENILFVTEQDDPRVEFYDFRKSYLRETKIYFKGDKIPDDLALNPSK